MILLSNSCGNESCLHLNSIGAEPDAGDMYMAERKQLTFLEALKKDGCLEDV